MRFGYSETCLEHDPGRRHPESPDRLRAIRRRLSREHAVSYTEAPSADPNQVEAVHDSHYVEALERFCADGGGDWDPDTTASETTWPAARRSAGLAIWAANRAIAGDDGRDAPFSLGRPPGHHAVTDDAMGFCFFNNAAVATAAAREQSGIDRVAIFDWDVHHGNGTQEIFAGVDGVLYTSVHEEGIYPGTGGIDETDGGTTLNVPVPAGTSDAGYCHVVDAAIAPAISRFDPDLLVISAGFDPHRHDPISRTRLSTEGFGLLTQRVRTLAGELEVGLAFVLEGGYGLETLSDGVAMVNRVFDGYDPVEPEDGPAEAVSERVDAVRDAHDLNGD
ncbi:MAG: histone deacetylase family protein [Halobacteriaceae archaeon]